MVVKMIKKKKDKKEKEKLLQIQGISTDMRDAILLRYFTKRKNKNT
jgi:endonuclease III-like uncharacterized protein